MTSVSGIILVSISLIVVLNHFISNWLLTQYDESFTSKINLFQTLTEYDEDGLDFEFADEFMSEYSRINNPEYFQIWVNDKEVFERSNSLLERDLVFKKIELNSIAILDYLLPNNQPGRIIYISFLPQVDDDDDGIVKKMYSLKSAPPLPIVTIAIAKERVTLNNLIFNANVYLSGTFIVLILFLAIVILFSIRRGLLPLENLNEQMKKIKNLNVENKIVLDDAPKELQQLIFQFNTMLKRLSDLMTRERTFSSDVAHELRTPISEIRTMTEVSLIGNESKKSLLSTANNILHVSLRMEKIVNSLLELARTETQDLKLDKTHLEIKTVIDGCIKQLSSMAIEKKIYINIHSYKPFKIQTSEFYFTRVIHNLLDNALRHGCSGESIKIEYNTDGQRFLFAISNSTNSLETSDLANVFQRMWKKDSSRTEYSQMGIGLSLVREYCRLLDYNIKASIEEGIFKITVQGSVTS